MTDRTTYHVYEERLLVYRQPGMAFYGVLANKNPMGGRQEVLALGGGTEGLRPATLEDFETFRVHSPPGYA